MSEHTQIEIISIGDELLTGHIANTNAAWMADQLLRRGFRADRITTVGDDNGAIVEALAAAGRRAKTILITGGLGPTHDDVTRTAVCQFFETLLILDEDVLSAIHHLFSKRGIPMSHVNRDQALVPRKARLMPNDRGTAPGYILNNGGATFYFMPGVPHEMRRMMEEYVLPNMQGSMASRSVQNHYLCTIGIAESTLYEKIGNFEDIKRMVRVAFLPGFSGVKIRISADGDDREETARRLAEAAARVRQNIQPFIYAEEDIPLEQLLVSELTARGRTVAVAESCTGGLLAHKFTNIPGSSKCFERGVVSYSNKAKMELLSVPEPLIAANGAVSEAVVLAMAAGVRSLAATDYGMATTGIAGPDGGTAEKPVGLVYVAVASEQGIGARRHTFIGDRVSNKERFAYAALNLLWQHLREADKT
jgi:nicotinamide-nucleotide amidase